METLESLLEGIKQYDELLDEVAFWMRYIDICIWALDKDIKALDEMIRKDPIRYALMK